MAKAKTIHEILVNLKKNTVLTDGVRRWKVVETSETNDCVVACPSNWKTQWGEPFELWDDAQAKVSYIKGLKVLEK